MTYRDRNGREIEPGMTLTHRETGEVWEVCRTENAQGEPDLGLSCNAWEAYPLWQFDLSEWEAAPP